MASFEKASFQIQVAQVLDGDTFLDIQGQSYRIHAVNTPELSAKNARQRQLAYAAKDYLENLIHGQTLTIKIETSDQYQRVVVRAFFQSFDLAFLLLEAGYAKVRYISLNSKSRFYTNDHRYFAHLLERQHRAFLAKKGVWNTRKMLKWEN